jgi:hypothetical protein
MRERDKPTVSDNALAALAVGLTAAGYGLSWLVWLIMRAL